MSRPLLSLFSVSSLPSDTLSDNSTRIIIDTLSVSEDADGGSIFLLVCQVLFVIVSLSLLIHECCTKKDEEENPSIQQNTTLPGLSSSTQRVQTSNYMSTPLPVIEGPVPPSTRERLGVTGRNNPLHNKIQAEIKQRPQLNHTPVWLPAKNDKNGNDVTNNKLEMSLTMMPSQDQLNTIGQTAYGPSPYGPNTTNTHPGSMYGTYNSTSSSSHGYNSSSGYSTNTTSNPYHTSPTDTIVLNTYDTKTSSKDDDKMTLLPPSYHDSYDDDNNKKKDSKGNKNKKLNVNSSKTQQQQQQQTHHIDDTLNTSSDNYQASNPYDGSSSTQNPYSF